MDSATKVVCIGGWLVFSVMFRVISTEAIEKGYSLGTHMLAQSVVGFVVSFVMSSQLRSEKPFASWLLETRNSGVLLGILAIHVAGTFAYDLTLRHTMLLSLLPLGVSMLSNTIIEYQDNLTILTLVIITVGATMVAGGECEMAIISSILNLMVVGIFTLRNTYMKYFLSNDVTMTIITMFGVMSFISISVAVPFMMIELVIGSPKIETYKLSLVTGAVQGLSNFFSFWMLQHFSAVAHSVIVTSGMVAFYLYTATVLGQVHHFTLFPILGVALNLIGILIYALLRRNADRKRKDKDYDSKIGSIDTTQFWLFVSGGVMILLLHFVCNLAGQLPSLHSIKGFFMEESM
eukprot:TRINITY_DN15253_c0_g1_i1.p1 TRINITY_DN15253_c0_g1~~TRINITY_DN15253_c0_g1_i1.p1  ORF type:complete len:361 (-),score=39.88 TRINITY_DN15253_c0_g1_i1:8-1051(-)